MDIKDHIGRLVEQALGDAQRSNALPATPADAVPIERPQNPDHGDFSCSLALKLARPLGMSPMSVAEVGPCAAGTLR